MAQINFNASNVEPATSAFSPLPADMYVAQVVDSDVRPNKAGTGQYLALQFQVLDGEYKGRRVFTNITIAHTNKTAEQIGQSQLSALCRAVGVMQLTDTAQLHGIPVKIRVKVVKDDQYGDSNEVTGFDAAGLQAAPTQAANAGEQLPPWMKR